MNWYSLSSELCTVKLILFIFFVAKVAATDIVVIHITILMCTSVSISI